MTTRKTEQNESGVGSGVDSPKTSIGLALSHVMPLVIYYAASALVGICVVLIPASSFLFNGTEGYRLTTGDYGTIYLPLVASALLSSFFYDRLAFRYGRRFLYYGSFAAYLSFLGLLFLVSKVNPHSPGLYWILFGSYVALGVGFGILLPTLNYLAAETLPRYRAGVLTGLHGCLGVGASFSPWIVHYFHQRNSWGSTFPVTASGFILVVALSLLFIKREGFQPGGEKPSHGLSILKLPPLSYAFIFAGVLYGTVETLIVNWTPMFLTADKGYSMATAAGALSFFWLFLTTGRFLVSGLALKIDARHLVRFIPLLLLAGFLLIVTNKSESTALWSYIIAGLGASCVFPVLTGILIGKFHELGDQMSGLMVMGLMLGIGIGSVSPGFLQSMGLITLRGIFISGLAISAILIGLIFLVTRKPAPK